MKKAVAKAVAKKTKAASWTLGQSYLIRTVTFTWTGRLVLVTDQELVLEDAAWIADTGRYHKATTIESLSEIEPRDGQVIIGRGSVVDAVLWLGPLPRQTK
jgi:hypothetical protein